MRVEPMVAQGEEGSYSVELVREDYDNHMSMGTGTLHGHLRLKHCS